MLSAGHNVVDFSTWDRISVAASDILVSVLTDSTLSVEEHVVLVVPIGTGMLVRDTERGRSIEDANTGDTPGIGIRDIANATNVTFV